MKQLSCKQLGGACDAMISGSTPEEMSANDIVHLKEAHPDLAAYVEGMNVDEKATWTNDVLMPLWNAA